MLPVYDAANIIDAHLVRHALEDAGIPVFIRGESLMGGVGELPAVGVVQVCVPAAARPEAEAIIRELGLYGGPAATMDGPEPDPGLPDGAQPA